MTQPPSEMSFEEAIAELEDIVGRLESGEEPLAESIKLYERGSELKKRCEEALGEAEQRVAKLKLGDNGEPAGCEPLDSV